MVRILNEINKFEENKSEINSKEYWDFRFGTGDWEKKQGREQSLFFYRLALELFPDWFCEDIKKNNLSFLDLGCAEGEGVNLFGEYFESKRVCGSDISAAALERAKKYYPGYRFFESDINKLSEDFDVIFSSNTLEHFENPEKIIKNILPHCKKYFVMLIPFREFSRIDEHFATFDYGSFPLKNNGFNLVFYKEADCREIANTQWPGEEIIAIYAKEDAEICKKTLKESENGNWDLLLNQKEWSKKLDLKINELKAENEALKEKIEEDRNAIMQIQFEAAQHKQEELDSRETYVWKTGLKIEKLLRKTGIAFIRSLLDISDYRRIGLRLTLKKGLTEVFERENAAKNKKLKLKLCKEKFLDYKEDREKKYPLNLKDISVPCQKGLISVVLPVFNGGDMVADAIESCILQTEKNFELIVVNDGSTDNTLEVVENFAKSDKRIKIINQENKKLPSALSAGFAAAKGEFLTWISADNVLKRDAFEIMKSELEENPELSMVYTNMKIIDKKGKIKRGHFWFEKPLFSGNVILPDEHRALNTFANNTVGASFMYKSKAGQLLGDYSRYKNTLEDYDYWMRMNSLLKISHSKEKKPLYYYRRNDNSLTSSDKELGITKNRYKLMVLDDFRRDFYMSPLVWIVETENENDLLYKEFKEAAASAGHMFLSYDDAMNIGLPEISSGAVYIYFGDFPDKNRVCEIKKYADAVVVSRNLNKENFEYFDLFFSRDQKDDLEKLSDYKGWFYAANGKALFAFADAKLKNNLLYRLEGMMENEEENDKKISIIICTYLRGEKLVDAIWSCLRQSFSKKEYEIVVVDNAPFESGIKEEIMAFAEKYKEYGEFIRYIAVPQKGLSSARNAGMWNAKGEYLLFLDDDALCDYYLLEELYTAFKYHPTAGIVGGQVILEVPFPRPSVLLKGFENIWSQFKVTYSTYKEATQQFEFPYGANYSARKSALWRAGGFRMCYGRVGNDYAGGEETALCFKMLQIGYTIGIQPKAKVLHRVDRERFNPEHVKKTIRAGIFTSYRFYRDLHTEVGWTLGYVREQVKITKGEIKKLKKKKVEPIEIFYKECYLSAWSELYDYMKKREEENKIRETKNKGV